MSKSLHPSEPQFHVIYLTGLIRAANERSTRHNKSRQQMVCGCRNHLHLLHIRILLCYRPQHGVGTQGQSLWLQVIRPLQWYSRIKDLRFKGGCHNEVPQTGYLNRNVLSHSLEARSLISRWQQDWFHLKVVKEGSVPSLAPSLWQSLILLGLCQDDPNLHMAFSLCLWIQISPKDCILGGNGSGVHPDQYDSPYLITSAMTLFTNKVMF